MLDSVSLSADAMPGDPAVVKEVGSVPAAHCAANLLATVAVKLPPFFGLITSHTS